ncbi:hypothetical protein NDR87_10745 [Nocardia sp. CDC159]|uniref:Uncharacterized protein n=1 Tax=Nocardia pulmonis TaxID=2951408 RepID=A0A9X2IW65_9NOCA|nr:MULTISPECIES: hypothetical protein [Nocardia]MCM6773948.1 hypothetical protein [Nocardia pulmonis]MCM6786835.1 hypothetical protein [Nocardia sp. CDC159]
MKRSTLALVTVGMILAGAGVVELLGDASAEMSGPVPHSRSAAPDRVHSP